MNTRHPVCVLHRMERSGRHSVLLAAAAYLACIAVAAAAQTPSVNAPLPDPNELLKRAIAYQQKLADQRERYSCRVTDQITETDGSGNLKKATTTVKELFFVNGIPIERLLSKNGKDLSPDEVKKQDQRVMKEAVKYSNQATANKETDKAVQQLQDFLSAMMLANGRRSIENGHSILDYNIVPNPKFQPKNLNQRIATVMQGTMSIDEQTGVPIDLNIRSVADLKIGGGLVANVHKGLWIHVHNHAEPDGVWLTDMAEGSGDMRAALFLHPYFRFNETTGGCKLYNATAAETGQAKPAQ
jgi:hypothetical protein